MIARTGTSLGWVLSQYRRERLGLSEAAAEQLAIAVRLYSRHLGREATMADLAADRVLDWLHAYAQQVRPATLNSKRSSLLCLWRYAASLELVSPPPPLARMTTADAIPVAWTLDQVRRIVETAAHWPGHWAEGVPASLGWLLGLSILWDTAARIGELWHAQIAHVQQDIWLVPAPHRKGRRRWKAYRLHAQTVELVERRRHYGGTRLWPFPHRRREIWPHYKRLLRSAGLPADRDHMFHCLRRTAESLAAAQRGVEWAAACVGHSPQVAQRHYINPLLCPGPALWEALPRPTDRLPAERQLRLF